MTIEVNPNGRVNCEASIELPMSASRAWGQLRDFHRSAAHDHFHAGFWIEGGIPKAGAKLVIEHRYGPFHVRRIGRILKWREDEGYAFSDLSMKGLRRGFPHVLEMKLDEINSNACELIVRVRGRWTAPTPRWMARWWLRWVLVSIVQRLRNDLLAFAWATQSTAEAARFERANLDAKTGVGT